MISADDPVSQILLVMACASCWELPGLWIELITAICTYAAAARGFRGARFLVLRDF